MLTDAAGAVDGVWLALSEIARRKNVSKQALSKRVARYCEQGLLVTRPGERGAVMVNLAEFDRVAGETTDFAREQGGRPAGSKPAEESTSASYTKAQAEEKRYKAEMARLDLELRLGKVLPIDQVEAAMIRVAEEMVRDIDRLPTRTDDPAVRRILKDFAHDMRVRLSASMTRLFDEGRGAEKEQVSQGFDFDGDED